MLYIGIDLGTSATKFLLVDESGKILNSISKEYPVIYPKSGWSEQDPNEWWNAVKTGVPELLQGFNGADVNGIGVAGQMHGLVVLDDNDNVIRNVILWNDGRTAKETEYLNTVLGKKKLSENTANIAVLTTDVAVNKQGIETLNTEISNLKGEDAKINALISTLQSVLTGLQTELATVKTELTNTKAELATANSNLAAVSAELTEFKSKY